MHQECRQPVEASNFLSRINDIFHSKKQFTIDELVLPLSEFTILNIAASLRQFARPNHKDRYSRLVQFLVMNPEIFAQIRYFLFVQTDLIDSTSFTVNSDDSTIFCFNPFPAIFLDFERKNPEDTHGHAFGPRHNFLKHLVFGFF